MELVQNYFRQLTDQQVQLLNDYEMVLKEWNAKINLISRKNEDAIVEQHILHSLAIAKFIQFQPYADVLDLGTGGGLPGIPLAILFPNTKFHLIDSIGKKIKAVNGMIDELGLKNATAEQVRSEQHKGSYDFVVTRAVAKSDLMVKWTQHLFKDYHEHDHKSGLIALKGGDVKDEMKEVKRPYQVIQLSKYFKEDFFETKKLVYIKMKK